MSTHTMGRLAPSDIAPEDRARLVDALQGGARPVLLTENGDVVEMPRALNALMVSVAEATRDSHVVVVLQEDDAVTTQTAAGFLGVSRQFCVRLLDNGDIPFHRVGTHRRVLVKDLVDYRNRRNARRRYLLDQMTNEAVAAGLDDRVLDLTRPDHE